MNAENHSTRARADLDERDRRIVDALLAERAYPILIAELTALEGAQLHKCAHDREPGDWKRLRDIRAKLSYKEIARDLQARMGVKPTLRTVK